MPVLHPFKSKFNPSPKNLKILNTLLYVRPGYYTLDEYKIFIFENIVSVNDGASFYEYNHREFVSIITKCINSKDFLI
jgi:hypothetical protein